MRQRHGGTWSLVVSCFLALAVSPSWNRALAGPITLPDPDNGSLRLESGPPAALATCKVGETRPFINSGISLGAQTGVTFYTLLDPATCSTCSGGVLVLRTANFVVRTLGGPCTFSVEVAIIGSKPGSACTLVPDPSAVLCGPVAADITSSSTVQFTASVPLPGNCCISRPAYLRIKLLSPGTCAATDPFWRFAGPCIPCEQFEEDSANPLADWCGFAARNLAQWVDADCCDATPSMRGTWGQLKTLYR